MPTVSDLTEEREKRAQPERVWQCMFEGCGRQDYLLIKGSVIYCNGCGTKSVAVWYVPEVRSGDTDIRRPKLKKLRTIENAEALTCGYCSGTTFHMHEKGDITCFRCKKPNLVRFFFPGQGTKP